MDKAKRTAIEHWFIKANNDIRAGNASLNAEPPITMDKEFPKTHDLTKLVGLCGKCDISFLELIPIVEGMTAYAVTDRYPIDEWREILLPEAQEALEKAEKIRSFVKGKIAL
jgi:hypothetical protein